MNRQFRQEMRLASPAAAAAVAPDSALKHAARPMFRARIMREAKLANSNLDKMVKLLLAKITSNKLNAMEEKDCLKRLRVKYGFEAEDGTIQKETGKKKKARKVDPLEEMEEDEDDVF